MWRRVFRGSMRANRCATGRQAALWHTCRRTPYPRQGVREMDVPKRKPKGKRWKNYLTRRDLQRRRGISSATIARMDARGELPPSIFLGGVHLYHKDDIEKFEKEWLRPKKPEARRCEAAPPVRASESCTLDDHSGLTAPGMKIRWCSGCWAAGNQLTPTEVRSPWSCLTISPRVSTLTHPPTKS